MGGDKKISHRYAERGGHGKTVVAEVTLADEAVRRVLRTTVDDLLELSWAGTHGAVASGMQSVAFTPATAIAAIFNATGQDMGMVGTSSMARNGKARRGRPERGDPGFPGSVGTIGGGTTSPMPAPGWRSWTARARQGLLRADRGRGDARARDLRFGRDGHVGVRRTSPRPTSNEAACANTS